MRVGCPIDGGRVGGGWRGVIYHFAACDMRLSGLGLSDGDKVFVTVRCCSTLSCFGRCKLDLFLGIIVSLLVDMIIQFYLMICYQVYLMVVK